MFRNKRSANTLVASTGRGVALLTIGSSFANAINYGINLALGRALKPKLFAEATLLVATTLVLAAVAIGMQLVTATVMARVKTAWEPRIQLLTRWCIMGAAGFGAVTVVLALPLAAFFRLTSAVPLVILGLGLPGYALLSVARGVLQGQMDFANLAATFVLEAVARAAATGVCLLLGLGVTGVSLGMSLGFVCAWLPFRSRTPLRGFAKPSPRQSATYRRAVVGIVRPVAVLLLAQVVINNEDVMFAMRSLGDDEAGRYSSLALVGRGIFFLSWAVVTALFPAIAQGSSSNALDEKSGEMLLRRATIGVTAIGGSALVSAMVFGDQILETVFGPAYTGLGQLLAMYALATTMFAITNLLATYHIALGNPSLARLVLCGAVLQTLLLAFRHSSPRELLSMQLVAMASTLVGVIVQHLTPTRVGRQQPKALFT